MNFVHEFFGPTWTTRLWAAFIVVWLVVFICWALPTLFPRTFAWLAGWVVADLARQQSLLRSKTWGKYVPTMQIFSLASLRRKDVSEIEVNKSKELLTNPDLGGFAKETISQTLGHWVSAGFDACHTNKERMRYIEDLYKLLRRPRPTAQGGTSPVPPPPIEHQPGPSETGPA